MQPTNEVSKNTDVEWSPEDRQAYAELRDAFAKVYGVEPDLNMLDSLSEEEQDKIIDNLLIAEQ